MGTVFTDREQPAAHRKTRLPSPHNSHPILSLTSPCPCQIPCLPHSPPSSSLPPHLPYPFILNSFQDPSRSPPCTTVIQQDTGRSAQPVEQPTNQHPPKTFISCRTRRQPPLSAPDCPHDRRSDQETPCQREPVVRARNLPRRADGRRI